MKKLATYRGDSGIVSKNYLRKKEIWLKGNIKLIKIIRIEWIS